eukprot:m.39751 g.39751  ORF g.39751 m.39751 type:complete len:281 (+) comp45656_c0_seq1:88-930(+)
MGTNVGEEEYLCEVHCGPQGLGLDIRGPAQVPLLGGEIQVINGRQFVPIQYISDIDPNGAAYAAGLRQHDRLLEVNGVHLRGLRHDQVVHFVMQGGDHLRMRVLRVSDSKVQHLEDLSAYPSYTSKVRTAWATEHHDTPQQYSAAIEEKRGLLESLRALFALGGVLVCCRPSELDEDCPTSTCGICLLRTCCWPVGLFLSVFNFAACPVYTPLLLYDSDCRCQSYQNIRYSQRCPRCLQDGSWEADCVDSYNDGCFSDELIRLNRERRQRQECLAAQSPY